MARTFDAMPPREALAAIGRDFHRRGWMAGTAGNLSCRDPRDPDTFWITASGLPKGMLEADDTIRVAIADGAVVERFDARARPSAETAIHQALYRLFPETSACLHVHTVDACLAAARAPLDADALSLPPLEMVKGLGIWKQHPDATLPLFDNWLDVPRIAAEIETRFRRHSPSITALMIRDHGVTVWGETLQQAHDRLEVLEFILAYLAARGGG